MYLSKCIPVNVKRTNCCVYSANKAFDERHLLNAYDFLTGNKSSGVYLEDDCIRFVDDPSLCWTVCDVYRAYDAYDVAMQNNFSFYVVRDPEGVPLLYISKQFHSCRILVNAFTMKSTLLTKKKLVNKAASLIDKTMEFPLCMNLFNTLSDFESEKGKYLSGLICYKGTDNEFLAVNPMITLMSENVSVYYVEVVKELRKVLEDPTSSNMFEIVNHHYVKKDSDPWEPMSEDHVRDIVTMYDSLLEKKSNYVEIMDTEDCIQLYFSTNHRYLVNASTFECAVIKNQNIKELLVRMVEKVHVPLDQISLIWMLAVLG